MDRFTHRVKLAVAFAYTGHPLMIGDVLFLLSILTNAYGADSIKHSDLFRGAYAKCFCLEQKGQKKSRKQK